VTGDAAVPDRSHTAGAGQGPVAVEVGAGVGTLVLWADADLEGAELELSPCDDDARRRHVAVLARRLPGRTVYAAVYPALPAGRYRLWDSAGRPAMTVDVPAGCVSEARFTGR
jgi:hypothetical protein